MILKFIFAILFLTVQTCDNQSNTSKETTSSTLPYDLSTPSASFKIDAPLLEISGLTTTGDAAKLACLSDEKGQLFYIDPQTGKVTPSLIFHDKGDFESIEFVEDTLWAMTSLKVWQQPFTVLRAPSLATLRMDPFERAEHENAMGYQRWYMERMYAMAPAGAYVGNWLQSFREFPPRQKPGSFNLDRVMEAVSQGAAGK